jgi:hypothetical protein
MQATPTRVWGTAVEALVASSVGGKHPEATSKTATRRLRDRLPGSCRDGCVSYRISPP